MPQSLSQVLLHLVFSTKGRAPLLHPEVREQLHAYMVGVLKECGSPSLQVGGTEDHVHVLFSLSRTTSIAEVVETLKTSTSRWLKTKGPTFSAFHWQAGYAVFSIAPGSVPALTRYIRDQEEHHRARDFRDELRILLRRHRVVFDERYVWD